MTKREKVALATAFEFMTRPPIGKEPDILDVIQTWANGEDYDGVIVWKPFENMSPKELIETLQTLTQTLLWFADNGDKLL